jgi:hypothetical protein
MEHIASYLIRQMHLVLGCGREKLPPNADLDELTCAITKGVFAGDNDDL